MGARHVGDVAILCGIARPDIAIVTNVGVAHLEVFGSWERIVEASAEPVEALGPDGVADPERRRPGRRRLRGAEPRHGW